MPTLKEYTKTLQQQQKLITAGDTGAAFACYTYPIALDQEIKNQMEENPMLEEDTREVETDPETSAVNPPK